MDRQVITSVKRLRVICRELETADASEEIASVLLDVLLRPRDGITAVGLSAPQLGYPLRMFIMRYGAEQIFLVNPIITKARGNQVGEEGCLSFPGKIVYNIKRPAIIKIKGLNEHMHPVSYKLTGFDARVACHEVDHLDGKLIIDYEQ